MCLPSHFFLTCSTSMNLRYNEYAILRTWSLKWIVIVYQFYSKSLCYGSPFSSSRYYEHKLVPIYTQYRAAVQSSGPGDFSWPRETSCSGGFLHKRQLSVYILTKKTVPQPVFRHGQHFFRRAYSAKKHLTHQDTSPYRNQSGLGTGVYNYIADFVFAEERQAARTTYEYNNNIYTQPDPTQCKATGPKHRRILSKPSS